MPSYVKISWIYGIADIKTKLAAEWHHASLCSDFLLNISLGSTIGYIGSVLESSMNFFYSS